jgi:hypothetical protein
MCGVEGSVMDRRDSKIDAGALSRERSRSWPRVITRATAFAHDRPAAESKPDALGPRRARQ